MKTQGAAKNEANNAAQAAGAAEAGATAGDNNGFFTPNEKIDFSKVKVEPLFEEQVDFETFSKSDFRAVKVKACEAVKKSKKLLCSQVQIGSQVRQIVSGIKAHYSAEEMVGKRVMVVTNLKPAKLAGILSEGMILCAEDADGNLSLMVPEKEMPAGAEIC